MVTICLCPDSEALGRLDYMSLSQQAMMELLVANVTNGLKDKKGNYIDISEWPGVVCDEGECVVEINWSNEKALFSHRTTKRCDGSLDMQWIPHTVRKLRLTALSIANFDTGHLPRDALEVKIGGGYTGKVTGTIAAGKLPRGLQTFDMSRNKLTGTFDVAGLPASLRSMSIQSNGCEGTLDFTTLPSKMEEFFAQHNKFKGEINLTLLPECMKVINLSCNQLDGLIDVSKLPDGLGRIDLRDNLLSGPVPLIGFTPTARSPMNCRKEFGISNNHFSGEIRYAGELPPNTWARLSCQRNRFTSVNWPSMKGVKILHATENALEGSLACSDIPVSLTHVHLDKNKISGSLRIENIHKNIQLIELQRNNFMGSVDLSRLPSSLIHFDVSENHLEGEIYFGAHIPAKTSLQKNEFTSIRTEQSQGWINVERFDASSNKITQDTVKFGKINRTSRFRFINLCGNTIQVCKMANGQVAKSKKIFYDNGTEAQRKPVVW